MKKDYFIEDFYCRSCGSTTAILIKNLKLIRCIGCFALYRVGDKYSLVDKHHHAWQPNLAPKPTTPSGLNCCSD